MTIGFHFFRALRAAIKQNRIQASCLLQSRAPLTLLPLDKLMLLGKTAVYHCPYSLKGSHHLCLCHPNVLLLRQLPTVVGEYGSRKPKFSE